MQDPWRQDLMPRFRLQDLTTLESSPTSPATLRAKIGELIIHSMNAAAQVEMVDRETGEYRVVLQAPSIWTIRPSGTDPDRIRETSLTDELLRPFQDKIRRRPSVPKASEGSP